MTDDENSAFVQNDQIFGFFMLLCQLYYGVAKKLDRFFLRSCGVEQRVELTNNKRKMGDSENAPSVYDSSVRPFTSLVDH